MTTEQSGVSLLADVATQQVDEDRFVGTVSETWQGFGPLGGYVAGICLDAAARGASFPRPVHTSVFLLRAPVPGDCELEVARLRAGTTSEVLGVRLTQDGRHLAEAVTSFGPRDGRGLERDHAPPPEVDGPERLERRRRMPSCWAYIDERVVTGMERDHGEPVARSWFRLDEDSEVDTPVADAIRTLLFADLPVWFAARAGYGWELDEDFLGRTSSLVAQFARSTASEWLLVEGCVPVATGGVLNGEVRVWADGKTPTCQSLQQMLLRPTAS